MPDSLLSPSPSAPPRRVVVPLHVDTRVPALGARVHALQGETMGTRWQVKLAGPPDAPLTTIRRGIERTLDTVVAQMSTWRADADLGRYNAAPAGSRHRLPAEFAQVMDCAQAVAAQSGGAFDAGAGALVDLWGFGPSGRHDQPGFVPPAADAVQQALAHGGWTRIGWPHDRARNDSGAANDTITQPGGLRLDLSAIAKGFGVDQVARYLLQIGLDHHLVEVGGELRGAGMRPDGQPWWVQLMTPPLLPASRRVPQPPLPETRIALHGLSVATSGDYLRWFEQAGQRRSHTIDPRSGWPVAHGLASVSVLHADCMQADAWSTALTVLGLDEGLALARRLDLAALFVQRHDDGRLVESMSPAFEAMAG